MLRTNKFVEVGCGQCLQGLVVITRFSRAANRPRGLRDPSALVQVLFSNRLCLYDLKKVPGIAVRMSDMGKPFLPLPFLLGAPRPEKRFVAFFSYTIETINCSLLGSMSNFRHKSVKTRNNIHTQLHLKSLYCL